jgi:ferredoxin
VTPLEHVELAAAARGLALRGAFHPGPDDAVPPLPDRAPTGTLVLLGMVGRRQWPDFAASPEAGDGGADPLDRWSRRVIDGLAAKLGAQPLYPFQGPPWLPFQRWAMKAEPVHRSALGMLIHPSWGLWHSYRGALAFAARWTIPAQARPGNPCDRCRAKPCLTACPVGAFSAERYDVDACAGHLRGSEGGDCLQRGCRARRACPVGATHGFGAQQAAFHMRAFLASRS